MKRELQPTFLVIMNYLGRFSPLTAEVHELHGKLMSSLEGNSIYHELYDRAKTNTQKDAAMVFSNGNEQLCLGTDVSG